MVIIGFPSRFFHQLCSPRGFFFDDLMHNSGHSGPSSVLPGLLAVVLQLSSQLPAPNHQFSFTSSRISAQFQFWNLKSRK